MAVSGSPQPETGRDRNKEYIVLNRNGEISVYDEKGRAVDNYVVPFGSTLKVKEDGTVKEGQLLAHWDYL